MINAILLPVAVESWNNFIPVKAFLFSIKKAV